MNTYVLLCVFAAIVMCQANPSSIECLNRRNTMNLLDKGEGNLRVSELNNARRTFLPGYGYGGAALGAGAGAGIGLGLNAGLNAGLSAGIGGGLGAGIGAGGYGGVAYPAYPAYPGYYG